VDSSSHASATARCARRSASQANPFQRVAASGRHAATARLKCFASDESCTSSDSGSTEQSASTLGAPGHVSGGLEVHREMQTRVAEVDQIRAQHVERRKYEADLARRRFMQVDPDRSLSVALVKRELACHPQARDEIGRCRS
jgi:hypothetical protein